MRIAGVGDLLAADDDASRLLRGATAAAGCTMHGVAVAELDAYVIELGSGDMAEVLQVLRLHLFLHACA